jgi:hypothetical protein
LSAIKKKKETDGWMKSLNSFGKLWALSTQPEGFALKILLLTGARRESYNQHDSFDLEQGVWTNLLLYKAKKSTFLFQNKFCVLRILKA